MTDIVSLQKNLLHSFKRKYVDAYSLQCHLKQHPETKRIIGCLPFDWLKDLPKDEFSKVTKEVDSVFSEFSILNLDREICHNSEMAERMDVKLENALQKVLNRQDVYVKLEGNGSYKCCRKIVVGNYSYALSTFFHDSEVIYREIPVIKHGPKIEPQMQFLVYKNYSHGRISKPFMAKIGTGQNLDGSYILMQYIDNNPRRSKQELNPLREFFYKLRHEDASGRNKINGVYVDIGGIELNQKEIQDKVFKNNLFTLLDRIYNENIRECPSNKIAIFDKIYENDAQCFLINEMYRGTDIYTADLRQLLEPLTHPKKKIAATKIIRRMRNMHNLLVKLKKSGELPKYMPYLDKVRKYQTNLIAQEIKNVLNTTF